MSTAWSYTDDPSDPCSYCLNWVDDPEDEFRQKAIPMAAPGVVATRIYRGTHAECEQMVEDYLADVRKENALYESGDR